MEPFDRPYRIFARDLAGSWITSKFRQQAKDSGVYAAARNLRKQGCSLTVALVLVRAL